MKGDRSHWAVIVRGAHEQSAPRLEANKCQVRAQKRAAAMASGTVHRQATIVFKRHELKSSLHCTGSCLVVVGTLS